MPDIEIVEDIAEKREALENAGLPPVPFDIEILKTVLTNPETWEPSVTAAEAMTSETTDESESNEEHDTDEDNDTRSITESDMVGMVSISPPMSPDTDPNVYANEIVISSDSDTD